VTTKGESALKAVKAVREEGCIVNKIIAIVDRLEGARGNLAKHQITLISLFTK
jgi:orotate phosphoribosyltransferase